MKIAGQVARVHPLFASTPQYFRAYLTDAPPDFFVTVKPEDLTFEQAQLDREAAEEGFRFRTFTDPFLERAAIQRAFAEHLFDRDTLLFHGSAVALDGRGYLFTARSGTGKSTHTRLWREVFGPGATMINDDRPFLQLTEDGVLVCGDPWSSKHGLDSNVTLPLQGICILEQGPADRIAPITAEDALPMLQKQAYCPLDEAKYPQFLRLVEKLANNVPLWRMECTKSPQAAQIARDAMGP